MPANGPKGIPSSSTIEAVADEPEVKRIVEVYRRYSKDRSNQRKWDERNLGNHPIIQERNEAIKDLLQAHGFSPLGSRKVLDVGCGAGNVLAGMLDLGGSPENLYGIDLVPELVAHAKKGYPSFNFRCANAERIEFPDSTFGLVLVFTVFSSILDMQMARNVAREVYRVLQPGAAILWYDLRYNHPFNPNVRGITLPQIRCLFPGTKMYLRPITLLPALARRLGWWTPVAYPLLASLTLMRTHYLGLLVKPPAKS